MTAAINQTVSGGKDSPPTHQQVFVYQRSPFKIHHDDAVLLPGGLLLIEMITVPVAENETVLVEQENALAWGIVPTSTAIREVSSAQLVDMFEKLTDNLSKKAGIDKEVITQRAFITPSCGTGSMDIPDAERVFQVLRETSQALKSKYGF